MSSNDNDDEPLPEGWILCKSKSTSGRKYYFHRKTGKSSWTKPKDALSPVKTPREKVRDEKKREEQRKSLKRKSEGCQDASTPKSKTGRVSETFHTPNTSWGNMYSSCSTSPFPTASPSPAKNLASNRLAMLRARLSEEAEREEEQNKSHHTQSSPTKSKDKNTTPMQIDTPKHKSESPSESKAAQSPNSEQSTSPSQFFTANKILCSMKAQLPETVVETHKDMFADIEAGISKHTAEYVVKHPPTPPQFSEASKIVSSIKSKLVSKSKDVEPNVYLSASDRMEALKRTLNNEVEDKKKEGEVRCGVKRKMSEEAMETDQREGKSCEEPNLSKMRCIRDIEEDVVLVVDTNIFIHELDVIKHVLDSHIKGYTQQPTLMVPWRVMDELDRLKDNNDGKGAICKRARSAMDYLYESLPTNNRIKGQLIRDASSHIYACELPDDEILNCCLQQAERGKSVILLSNDKNLCNKAMINSIRCISLNVLKTLLENRQPACDPGLRDEVAHYQNCMYRLLANILECEMRARYKSIWRHVVFKPPPWRLLDVVQCLLKHWLAVFNEVFPRIEHLFSEFKNALIRIEEKDAKSLTQSEVANFCELCLDIAKKCQIIPEYMELAKQTVEWISNKDNQSDVTVVRAFENVWTVLSSYCAKLASGLGVPHELDDKVDSNEPLELLKSKIDSFREQINDFAEAMKGVLNMSEESESVEEAVTRLETAFKNGLSLLSLQEDVRQDNLRLFCVNCRAMLQEAYKKFSQLTGLLTVCREVIDK